MQAPKNMIGRARELAYRATNSALLSALHRLNRNSATTYRLDRHGIAASFEGAWFRYSPREYGCTGNIDYAPEAENETRAALADRLQFGDVLYDIGAHGGVYTITMQQRVKGLTVHSFEPQPEDLLANLALNQIPADNVHAVAVGDKAGSVRMTTGRRSSNHVSETGGREVPIVTLDDYAAERGLLPPTWIKIDIEGLELPALKGAERLLRKHKPSVICEINHISGRFGTTVAELLRYMRSLGYEIQALEKGSLRPLPHEMSNVGYSADWNFWFIHGSEA